MDKDRALRDHLLELLRCGSAHLDFDKAIADLPANLRGVRPEGSPHSVWELVEHLRFTQWDILDFSRNPDYATPNWPEDYWPKTPAPANDAAWEESVAAFHRDLKAMQDLVADPKTDLYAKIPWGDGQTILREAMLVADHNAYHLGQIVLVRQMLGDWG
ncbi:MAG TPA: DinB family protein [Thermoanaerobaculia bacterium]|nr:DinB family protein [Thermoanaerobaculia bacterium]